MLMNPINHGGSLYAAVSQMRNWNWNRDTGNVNRVETRPALENMGRIGKTNSLGSRDQMNTHYWMGKNVNMLA